jgi:hypothetical protein
MSLISLGGALIFSILISSLAVDANAELENKNMLQTSSKDFSSEGIGIGFP